MNERCSTLLLNRLPSKEKDLGSFTIPCQVSNLRIDNALADLGASISLMSYTMYEKLGLGEPKPTRMSLELADRSIQYPRGIVENVLIKVDKFVLPIDFVILDMPENSRIPIILGRPFLATARAMINRMIECYGIDELDVTIGEKTQEILEDNRSDSFEGLGRTTNQCDPKNSEQGNFDNHSVKKDMIRPSANEIDEKKPELKNLPSQLEYAYLHDHLSRLENPNTKNLAEEDIVDKFPDEHLMMLKAKLNEAEPCIFKDAKEYVMKYDVCQKAGNISSRNEMPQNNIQQSITYPNGWRLKNFLPIRNMRFTIEYPPRTTLNPTDKPKSPTGPSSVSLKDLLGKTPRIGRIDLTTHYGHSELPTRP
ncbi:DNA-directed DNA polymerase [Tanacetum coccineum]